MSTHERASAPRSAWAGATSSPGPLTPGEPGGTLSFPRRRPLLEVAECAEIWDTVRGLERYWIRRHPTAPSFTLGAACYLDANERGIGDYLQRAVRQNGLLRRRFTPLYERLRLALEAELGAPARYTDRYGLPGFHVFQSAAGSSELEPKLHFDLQDVDLDWADGTSRLPGARISFTVAIITPAAGAGLYLWDLQPGEDLGPPSHEEAAEAKRRSIEYNVGELFIHTGDHLHMIDADRAVMPGESRVTLQGHGRRTNGAWILYW